MPGGILTCTSQRCLFPVEPLQEVNASPAQALLRFLQVSAPLAPPAKPPSSSQLPLRPGRAKTTSSTAHIATTLQPSTGHRPCKKFVREHLLPASSIPADQALALGGGSGKPFRSTSTNSGFRLKSQVEGFPEPHLGEWSRQLAQAIFSLTLPLLRLLPRCFID